MIYLFFGDDSFSIREALSTMKEESGPADLRDVNTTVFTAGEVDFDRLAAVCKTVPFMSERRLVIVEGLLSLFERRAPARDGRSEAGGPQEQWSGLPDLLAAIPDTTDLVFVDGRLRDSNPLLRKLRGAATVRTFPLPTGARLADWIRERVAGKGAEIEPGAVAALADLVGGDLQAMDTEMEKLVSYCWGRPVREADVEKLVTYAKEANIFATVDAALEGRPKLAIAQVRQLLESGRTAAYLMAMLARQVRLLLLAKDLKASKIPEREIPQRLGLAGYPLRKTLQQEARFDYSRLVRIHHSLLEADLSVKTGACEEELAVELLVAEICASADGAR